MKSLRPAGSDVLIVLGLFAIAIAWSLTVEIGNLTSKQMDAPGYALLAVAILPLTYRSRFPLAVAWIGTMAWIVYVGLNYSTGLTGIALFIAFYGVGSLVPKRRAYLHAALLMAISAGWTLIGHFVYEDIPLAAVLMVALVVAVPFAFGRADRIRRERFTELEVRHARKALAAEEAAADAVRAERARIARELHDVVAHEVTVMTLQAEGARRLAKDADPRIQRALATISDSGRTGLAEMQRMIGVLRTSEEEAAERAESERAIASGGGTGRQGPIVIDESHAPMPSLAALPALAQHVEQAGLPVRLEIAGNAHVPAGVEVQAYRIVQEALTNALKHAGPGAHATVAVRRETDRVEIVVEDDGRGAVEEAVQLSGGHGLTGMRERVQAVGGTFEHGLRRGGGYRVRAVLASGDDQVGAAQAAVKGAGK